MDRLIKNHATTTTEIGYENRLTKEEKNRLVHDLIKRVFDKINKFDKAGSSNKVDNQELDIANEQRYTIDRFEANYAVCENRETRKMINIDVSNLPNNVQEGDILVYKDNTYTIDEIERKEIEERINEKIKNIFED